MIRICLEEHVPIYHGKIDKTLFPGAARRRSGRSPRSTELGERARYFRAAAASCGGAAAFFFGAAGFFDAAATDARSASIRSTTGVGADGSGVSISCPSSFASSSSRSDSRYSLRSSAGSNGAGERRDDLLRELELRAS